MNYSLIECLLNEGFFGILWDSLGFFGTEINRSGVLVFLLGCQFPIFLFCDIITASLHHSSRDVSLMYAAAAAAAAAESKHLGANLQRC